MNRTPYWIDTAPIKSSPSLGKDIDVDVLVVGAGVTGITTAYLLNKAGLSVALVERERFASIDTGHTTAHLTFVTDNQLSTLAKDFGEDHAQATWDAGAAAIDEIERIVAEEDLQCEFVRTPGYLHVQVDNPSDEDVSSLKKEAAIVTKLGFDAAFIEQIPYFKIPGVRFANQAKFHPRKYLGQLLEKMSSRDAQLFEKSAATEFDAEKRRAKVNDHWVGFDRLVLATNNPLVGLASVTSSALFQTKLSLYTSYALGAHAPVGSIPEAMFWDTRNPYNYLRVDRHRDHDYIIFGGEDHKTGQVEETEQRYGRVKARLTKIAPQAEVDHTWSGQIIETNDGLPYIGENAERQFIATGYCGNGITFGTIAAVMARDWATGRKNPWRELFAVDRKKIKGAAWDYVKENADYPYYLIKDRLARAEADSVRDLKPGDGAIIKSRGKKVAAYRSKNGTIHKISAVCTHMGCLVRWNSAESTWDCPCHGSRFKPTGEVIAGPAEESLGKA